MLDNFYTCHPLFEEYTTAIEFPNRANLPIDLVNALDGKKEASYHQGFVSLVHPDRYRDLLTLWDLDGASCSIFLKFAFGALVFFQNAQFKLLDPVYNRIEIIGETEDFDFIMNLLLCDIPGLNNSLFLDIYVEVKDALGIPELDECYAFTPPLHLGGSQNRENVRKVKFREQLIILSQL